MTPFRPLLFACLGFGIFAAAVSVLTGSALAGMAAALVAAAAWHQPSWCVIGLVLSAPFVRSFNSELVKPLAIAQAKTAAALLVGVIWAAHRIERQEENQFPRWMAGFFGGWFFLTLLTTLHSNYPGISGDYLCAVAGGVVLFVITFHLERPWQRRILAAVLLSAGAIAVLGIMQYVIVTYRIFPSLARFIVEPRSQNYVQLYSLLQQESDIYRSSGTMLHANQMGFYFALLTPFCFALLGAKSLPARQRLALLGLALLMALGLYVSRSRGAILAAGVSLATLGLHRGYRRLWGLGALALVALAGTYLASPDRGELWQHWQVSARVESGLSGREEVWLNALEIIRDSPFLGVGPGAFPAEYFSRFGFFVPSAFQEQYLQMWFVQALGDDYALSYHSHHIYLGLLAELGVGGLLLYGAGLWLVILDREKRARLLPEGTLSRALSLAVVSVAAGIIVYGFFDSQMSLTRGSLNLMAGPMLALGLRA